jgi:(4-(4-[2-(gamma-L-glutamylamino)ethyl]phenoxymethyl)furan-2-yl)methanamine synthase
VAEVFGWDVGGAHVKVCRRVDGAVREVVQWPCPLWQGLEHLQRVLDAATSRWPGLSAARHAATMTGEMTDLFEDRRDGALRIAGVLAGTLGAPRYFAGDAGWCGADALTTLWPQVASANWLAAARHCARVLGDTPGVFVDIGSTTTDFIAFAHGGVPTRSRSDAERLARGELVYHGVVRTPLCALARRIGWRGERLNVMNEFFATTADIYRLTGELDPAHDQHPSADGKPKDAPHTRARLARMIGLDARDGSDDEWLAFARAWRAEQLAEWRGQLDRVIAGAPPQAGRLLVAAGCGALIVPALADGAARVLDYGRDIPGITQPDVAVWASVCAPSVAVAALLDEETR